MGVWAHLFESEEKANLFKKRMSKKWLTKNGEAEDSWELIGDDLFQDDINCMKNNTDIRNLAYLTVRNWIKHIDSFYEVDKAALTIAKKVIKEYGQNLNRENPK